MKLLWILIALAVVFLRVYCIATGAPEAITFRVGASIGQYGPCAPLHNDILQGYKYFFNWLDQQPPTVVSDASGKLYQLHMQLRLVSHNCTEAGRADAMTSLINGSPANPTTGAPAEPPVHVLLGGHGDNALEDALQANAASRLLIHCCTARDTVFHRGLRHVYGLLTPASLYTGTVLRTMALRGLQRVAVVYTRESPLHVQLCEGALAQLRPLGELRPGFRRVLALNYSAVEAGSLEFWSMMGARVAAEDADVLIACDSMDRTSQLIHELRTRGHRLSALWLASSGNAADFLHYLDGHGEYALTTVQWMPNLPYADPDFGTAAEYTAAFVAATGQKPSYFSAAATASGYVLQTALRQALSMCSLGNATTANKGILSAVADVFMWDQAGALSCGMNNVSQRALDMTASSGTAVLQHVLSSLNMDTFFGPVCFNSYRQNIFHPVIVTQVLYGELVTVLPLDVAEKALVMPIPVPESIRAPKPWPRTAAGLSIITLLCCLGLVCVGLAVLMYYNRTTQQAVAIAAVEIVLGDIQVDIPPQVNSDGSCEPGEGVYRGTRVKLVVASELLQPGTGLPAAAGSCSRIGTREFLSMSQIPINPLEDRELASSGTAMGSDPCGLPTSSRDAKAAAATYRLQPPPLQQQQQLGGAAAREPLKQSESVLRSASSSTMPGTVQQPSSGGGSGGSGAAAVRWPAAFLGRHSRRQVLALVWRAVRLQHPRMCPVLGIVWEWPGLLEGGGKVPVLVRQWHEFDSLDRLLENETVPLPLLTKASIAQGVAEGLAYLHAQEPRILAGPLDASRIIIDKNFDPHLFLRLRNLDPEYGTAIAAAPAGTPEASRSRPRVLPSLCNPQSTPPVRMLNPPAIQRQPSPLQLPLPSQQPDVVPLKQQPPQLSGDIPDTLSSSAQSTCFAVAARTAQAVPPPPPPPDVRLHQPAAVGVVDGVGTSNSTVTWSQTAMDYLTGRMSVSAGPGCSGIGGGGGGASGAPPLAAAAALPPPYQPSIEQDVYEFGMLLCGIFMVSSTVDSGWLRFALQFSHVPGADGETGCVAPAAVGSGGGGGGGVSGNSTLSQPSRQAVSAPSAPQSSPAPLDDHATSFALSYLRSLCPQLADVARSCLNRDSGLTFAAIAQTLEFKVIPALNAATAATAGSDCGVGIPPRINRRNGGQSGVGMTDQKEDVGVESVVMLALDDDVSEPGGTAPAAAAAANGNNRDSPSRNGVSDRGDRRQVLKGDARVHCTMLTPDDLIFDFFPPKVARALRAGETVQPERYECVSIFFSDVVGYTDLCGQLQPGEVMDLVHRLYSRFDDLIRELRLFKVETVGDAYLAVGNLRWPQPGDHARLMAQFALAAVRAASSLPVHPDRPELGTVHVRVGLHCGPVVGSVVGTLNRRFCLFGDAVNTAARMEHNSEADRINCSAAFAALLREQWPEGPCAVSRGVRQVKGKGAMELFWLVDGQPGGGAATEGSPRSATKQGLS